MIHFEKWNAKTEDFVRCHAPAAIAMTLLARSGAWNFPTLISVVSAPTLRPDGSILDQPGYDPATGLFFDAQNEVFPPIPAEPSREEGLAALQLLKEELFNRPCLNSQRSKDQGFSFTLDSDRSAAIAAVLTALVRSSLPTAPLFLVRSTRPGSAKSLLADIPPLVATGRTATVLELGADADEVEKRMLAVLLSGDLVINLDNLEVPLGGATLCKVLTGELFTGRMLGFNKTATVPTYALFLATGNNIQVIGDMTRRVVVINLEPQSEAPEKREYDRNLMTWIPDHRPRLVQAGLTVLRSYIAAGRPKQSYPVMGSFEDWDRMVRRALTWLGEADPLAGTSQLESDDPVRRKLRALLVAWYETFCTAGATSREAVARAQETQRNEEGEVRLAQALWEVLSEHFTDRRGDVRAQLIGEFIRKYDRRVEIGARFENEGTRQDRQIWRVAIVDEKRFLNFHAWINKGDRGDRGDKDLEPSSSPLSPPSPYFHPSENFGGTVPPSPGESCESVSPRSEIFAGAVSLSEDATTLAKALKFYRGWAEPGELARKSGLGSTERVLTAAQELVLAGFALIERGMVKPTTQLAGAQK